MIRAIAIVFTIGLAASASARADGDCQCDQYRDLVPQIRHMIQTGRVMDNLSSHRRAFDEVREDINEMIPDECLAEFGIRVADHASVTIRHRFSDPLAEYPGKDAEMGNRLIGHYNKIRGLFSGSRTCEEPDSGASRLVKTAYADCLEANNREAFQDFRSAMEGRTSNNDLDGYLSGLDATERQALSLYHQIVIGEDVISHIRENRDNIDFDAVVGAALMYGKMTGSPFYDDERADGNDGRGASGVDFEESQAALLHNYAIGFTGDGPLENRARYEVVCRDAMTHMAQMVEAAGGRNIVLVGLEKDRGGHMYVMGRRPDADRPFIMDWGSIGFPSYGDSRAFFQGPADRSIDYRLYEPAGRQVHRLLSEQGRFLMTATGLDVDTFEGISTDRSNMVRVESNFSPNGEAGAHMFRGSDGLGAEYVGAGLHGRIGNPTDMLGELRYGMTFAQQDFSGGSVGLGHDADEPRRLDIFFGALEHRLSSGEIELTPDLKLRLQSLVAAYGSATLNDLENEGDEDDIEETIYQGDVRVGGNARLEHGDRYEDRFSATYRVGVQGGLGRNDSRGKDRLQTMTPFLQYMLFSAEGRMTLHETEAGRTFLTLAGTLIANELGTRGVGEMGIVTPYGGFMGRVEGRLDDDDPLFLDRSERRAGVTLSFNPTEFIGIALDASAPIESRNYNELPVAPPEAYLNLKGRF